jgi:hypothetical protein
MTCKEIKEYLDAYYEIDISVNTRKSEYIIGRSQYYVLAYKYGIDAKSYAYIAQFVNKDHCAYINAKKTHEGYMLSDANYRKNYDALTEFIKDRMSSVDKEIYKSIQNKTTLQLIDKYAKLTKKHRNLSNKYNRLRKERNSLRHNLKLDKHFYRDMKRKDALKLALYYRKELQKIKGIKLKVA